MTREEALASTDLRGLLEQIGSSRGLHRRGKDEFPCPDSTHEQTGGSPPCRVDPQGTVWRCHSCEAGGSAVDALVACGWARDVADALRQLGVTKESPAPEPQDRHPEAEYIYHDADNTPIFKVVRFPGKQFRQMRYEDGRWSWGHMDRVTRQLYHLPEVLKAVREGRWVFLCEGEKDAEAIRATGRCATTNVGGALKWEDQYSESLKGAKVVVLADDDEPGRQHASLVYQKLYGKFTTEIYLRLPRDGCKDIFDHLAAGHPFAKLSDLRALDQPPPPPAVNGNGSRSALTAAVFASRVGSDKELEVLGPLFQRGMRTVIGAQTGEGKTTLALQSVRAMIEGEPFLGEERWTPRRASTRALVIDLEQGEETLKVRLREAGLDTCERVDILWEPSGIALDKREEDRAMVEDILREGGYDMVVLDPLYQSHLGSGNDEQVAAEVMRYVDGWARKYHCSLVIPMHARKPSTDAPRKFTKHDIAGSTSWLRNAEFILGLQMRSSGYSQLWFFKDRIGRGPEIGKWWGLNFDRGAGFKRNNQEDANLIKAAMKELLSRDEGATRADLLKVTGAYELLVEQQVRLKSVHERDGRYRLKPWTIPGQTTLLDETS